MTHSGPRRHQSIRIDAYGKAIQNQSSQSDFRQQLSVVDPVAFLRGGGARRPQMPILCASSIKAWIYLNGAASHSGSSPPNFGVGRSQWGRVSDSFKTEPTWRNLP